MAERDTLGVDDLLLKHEPASNDSADLNLDNLEARTIREAVAKHAGNLSRAAKELGLGRTTLYRKMAKHGI
jgi:transcriptional regulator of acetoin/glycerol metabolism